MSEKVLLESSYSDMYIKVKPNYIVVCTWGVCIEILVRKVEEVKIVEASKLNK